MGSSPARRTTDTWAIAAAYPPAVWSQRFAPSAQPAASRHFVASNNRRTSSHGSNTLRNRPSTSQTIQRASGVTALLVLAAGALACKAVTWPGLTDTSPPSARCNNTIAPNATSNAPATYTVLPMRSCHLPSPRFFGCECERFARILIVQVENVFCVFLKKANRILLGREDQHGKDGV